jgi:hypothetical protein
MSTTSRRLLVWLPRILGIATGVFIGVFALDAFGGGKPLLEQLAGFAIHLIPAAVVLTVVAVAFKYPWVGGLAFIGLGIAYAMSVRRLDWIAVIAGPLWTVGLLFLWSALSSPPRRAS